MEYNEYLQIADKILDLLTREGALSSIDYSAIRNSLPPEDEPKIHQALKILTEDGGYLTKHDSNYSLHGSATKFIIEGKYKGFCEREKERIRKLNEKEALEKTQIESVITTNTAVQNSFDWQSKFSKRSLWLAFLSIVFIAITALLQFLDKTPQRIEELKQEVKETSQTLKDIQSSLKEVNSSIQNIKIDTVFVKQK